MRFTFRCGSAKRLPTTMVRTASRPRTPPSSLPVAKGVPATMASTPRARKAKAAAFTPAAMKAVVGVGAPS